MLDDDDTGLKTGDKNTLTGNSNFVWTDKADPEHSDTTADWANGYGLNMDVLTNNAFVNK